MCIIAFVNNRFLVIRLHRFLTDCFCAFQYLEPDQRYGFGKLQQVNATFPANKLDDEEGHQMAAVQPTARGPPIVGAIRWDAYFSQPGEPAFEDPNFGCVLSFHF